MVATTIVHSVCLGCSDSSLARQCCVVLPRQSLLGTYEGPNYRAEPGAWPAMFVCLRHKHWCMRSEGSLRHHSQTMALDRSVPPMWRVVLQCAKETCGRWHQLYIGNVRDWDEILRALVELQLCVPCDSHTLRWKEELIQGEPLAF